MKTRIVLATAGMLVTLGTAVSSSAITSLPSTHPIDKARPLAELTVEVTPEMIATWRATAATRDYVASKRPI